MGRERGALGGLKRREQRVRQQEFRHILAMDGSRLEHTLYALTNLTHDGEWK
jgi:hypothetical protein